MLKSKLWIWGTISLLLTVATSCSTVGPQSIGAGRLQYGDAINRTEDQQILLSIVKGRYGETSSLLAVSGVAANIRFGVRAGIEAGFSAGTAPLGDNLITGGVAYEENPTITYVPIQGEKYVRQIMTPLPLDMLIMLLRSSTFKGQFFSLVVSRINNLSNPSFLYSEAATKQGEFNRFVYLLTYLSKAGILNFFENPDKKSSFYLLVRASSSEYTQAIAEFLSLLSLTKPEDLQHDIVIPVYFSEKPINLWGIGIATRSMFDLLEILRANVEIPTDHIKSRIALDYPTTNIPGRGIRIRSSEKDPSGASIAVKFRGYWFYVGETDHVTKAAFSLLRSMWSFAITNAGAQRSVPVLTLPVNR